MRVKTNTNATAARMLVGMAAALSTIACNTSVRPSNDNAVERAGGKLISSEEMQRKTKVDGHRVYVPVYAHVYHMENEVYNLTNTLSIRNTDTEGGIHILTAKYYDSKGKLLRDYVKNPILLPPLATLEYIIGVNDATGGSGANFIVEWMSDRTVTTPVIECVTIGTQSQQGISFISNGHVLD
jgi:hypothetical protein